MLGDEREDEPQVGVREVLDVVDEHVPVAVGDARAHVRALEQAQRQQHEVAGVERALLAQHPVVGAVDLRELALALGALVAGGQPRRPRPATSSAVTARLLEAVDPSQHAGEHRRRVAAEVVQAQRQLVDALEQHREPVGVRDGHDERVEARLVGLVAQQARAEPVDGVHVQLREAVADPGLDLGAQLVDGGHGVR